MLRRSLVVGLLVASLAGLGSGCASAPPPAALPTSGSAGELQVSGLLLLAGQIAQVRYTPGSLDRAARAQARLQDLAVDWSKWSGRTVTLGAYVLTRDEWEAAGGALRPYGMAQRVGRSWIALPATGDPATVTLWEELLGGGLPAAEGLILLGTPAEASSLAMADHLAVFELAAGMVEVAGLVDGPVWLRDLVAHVVAGSSLLRFQRDRLGDVAGLYQRAAASHRRAALGDVVPDQPAGPWLAWQARLYDAAQVILDDEAEGAPARLAKMRKRKGAPLTIDDLVKRWPTVADVLTRP